jgi:hypothetical protein
LFTFCRSTSFARHPSLEIIPLTVSIIKAEFSSP